MKEDISRAFGYYNMAIYLSRLLEICSVSLSNVGRLILRIVRGLLHSNNLSLSYFWFVQDPNLELFEAKHRA